MKFILGVMTFLLTAIPIGSAEAEEIDFTDGVFTVIEDSNAIGDEPVIFSEQISDATLTFESTLNSVGIERFLGLEPGVASNGLHLGGGSGSTLAFTITPDADVILESYSTNINGGFFLNPPLLDIVGLGVNSAGNSLEFGNAANLFNGSSIGLLLTGGETYDVTFQTAGGQAFIQSFEVTAVGIPEPATTAIIPMVFATIVMRRRRR